MATPATYDDIGRAYGRFRRPDRRIALAIEEALGGATSVVNVGAGTGSYESRDRRVVAVEPSVTMIRQRPVDAAPCVRGVAAHLPFPDRAFDAATALLTVHHWDDVALGLRELRRVADGVVVWTYEPSIHNSFWLFREYVPAVLELPSLARVPTVDAVAELVGADRVEPLLVPADCADGFGWAYWRRPERYLDPAARACISAFGLVDPARVEAGIARLRADLASGAWHHRHGHLLERDEIDGGFRLVIRDAR